MLSSAPTMANGQYYPPIAANSAPVRLTEHPDASLVTVFPFGVDDDFEYQDAAGRWRRLPSDGGAVAFAGHLLEWMSGGRAKALNHRVRLGGSRRERFSFADELSMARPDAGPTRRPYCTTIRKRHAGPGTQLRGTCAWLKNRRPSQHRRRRGVYLLPNLGRSRGQSVDNPVEGRATNRARGRARGHFCFALTRLPCRA